jgi:hypothetical protein
MNTNTLLALLVGGVVVYLFTQRKDDKKETSVPKCKDNEVLKKSQPNCLVAPCPTLYSCELKKSL